MTGSMISRVAGCGVKVGEQGPIEEDFRRSALGSPKRATQSVGGEGVDSRGPTCTAARTALSEMLLTFLGVTGSQVKAKQGSPGMWAIPTRSSKHKFRMGEWERSTGRFDLGSSDL